MAAVGERGKNGRRGPARRFLHLCAPVLLVYYAIPDDCWIGVPKRVALLVILVAVLLAELLRLVLRADLPELRPYERAQVSAYAWASFAYALAFLFFDPALVVPVILGMAWIDPLCSFSRKHEIYPVAPLAAYVLLMAVALWLVSGYGPARVIVLSMVGGAVEIASEYPKLGFMDDDFAMVFFPLLALSLVNLVF